MNLAEMLRKAIATFRAHKVPIFLTIDRAKMLANVFQVVTRFLDARPSLRRAW